MEGASLREAQMERAFLFDARIVAADLSWAVTRGAILFGAQTEGAIVRETDFRSAQWAAAQVGGPAHSADVRGASRVTQAQLNAMIGDGETLLPETVDGGTIPSIPSGWVTRRGSSRP